MTVIQIPRANERLHFDSIVVDNAFKIDPARYAKGKVIVQTPSDTGWKTRAGRLADTIARGNYTNREKGYVMSPSQAEKFQKLFAEGWDASSFTRTLQAPQAD
jgi:hypothetical protein